MELSFFKASEVLLEPCMGYAHGRGLCGSQPNQRHGPPQHSGPDYFEEIPRHSPKSLEYKVAASAPVARAVLRIVMAPHEQRAPRGKPFLWMRVQPKLGMESFPTHEKSAWGILQRKIPPQMGMLVLLASTSNVTFFPMLTYAQHLLDLTFGQHLLDLTFGQIERRS